jgi:hypothetical protein
MTVALVVVAIVAAGLTLFFAVRSREFCKFLSGAFFVSGGIQIYLYLARVSVPLLGTNIVQTPRLSTIRGTIHLLLSALTFYFGFVRKPRRSAK